LEIPLNIQDTALFYPRRLALSDADALRLCKKLLSVVSQYGGVSTVSWHDRSLEPERLWGDFYIRLLQELHTRGAWVGSACQVVEWFRLRRSIIIEETGITGNKINLKIRGVIAISEPHMFIRLHIPHAVKKPGGVVDQYYRDIPWNGEKYLEIPLN
jgi:hypothetical protein